MKNIYVAFTLLSASFLSAQITTNEQPQTSITGENAFMDASSGIFNDDAHNGKGLVFPRTDLSAFRFKTTNITPFNFANSFDGMIVYNTTEQVGATIADPETGSYTLDLHEGFYYFSNPSGTGGAGVAGGRWKPFSPSAAALGGSFWTLTGNTGTTPVTVDPANFTIGTTGNFIGTTDAQNVVMATNNVARLEIGPKTGVPIGGANFDYVLDVYGKARFRQGMVTEISTYPDYVFEQYFTGKSDLNSTYKFKTLAETEKFIKENNHLPGVTKITSFSKDGGKYLVDASELSVQNLEKVEELYLHTIEQQKQIDALKAELAEIKAMLKK